MAETAHFTYNTAKVETVTVKGDGSTVLNVYYTRNAYTLTFRELNCNKWHTHKDSCYKVIKTITRKVSGGYPRSFPDKEMETTPFGGMCRMVVSLSSLERSWAVSTQCQERTLRLHLPGLIPVLCFGIMWRR